MLLLAVVPLTHSAAHDEGQELQEIVTAQTSAKEQVLAGLAYLQGRPANATTLAQNSYPFLHALKEALQSGVITKEDLLQYKTLFKPVTALLAGVMQSGVWNNRIEALYAERENDFKVREQAQKVLQEEQKVSQEDLNAIVAQEQEEEVRSADQPYMQTLFEPEEFTQEEPAGEDEALLAALERSLQNDDNEEDLALQAAIAESIRLQQEQEAAQPNQELVEAASSQTSAERAAEQGEKSLVEIKPVFADITLSIDGQEEMFTIDVAAIEHANNVLGRLAHHANDKVSMIKDFLENIAKDYVLDKNEMTALLKVLALQDKNAMRSYLADLDKDTKLKFYMIANYLDAPLLQEVSKQLLEGVATQEDLKPELWSEYLLKKIVNNALTAYVGGGWFIHQMHPLWGHEDAVFSVAFSLDSTKLVSGSKDKTIRIWDAVSGEQIGEPLKGHRDSVNSVAWSPDGTKIVSGSDDKTVRIWDVASGKQTGMQSMYHFDSVTSVAWSPNGTKIASGSLDGMVRIWDAASGTQEKAFQSYGINSVAWSPDGTKIVSGSVDSRVYIWNAETGERIGCPLIGHNNDVNSVVFSSDGKKIVSGSRDGTVRIWDVASGEQEKAFTAVDSQVFEAGSVALSPDSTSILFGLKNKMYLWDVASSKQIGGIDYRQPVYSVVFSPDGTKIAHGYGGRQVWLGMSSQALVNLSTFNELLVLEPAVASWQEKHPYFLEKEDLAALKERYKDSVIAPLLNDERLFAVPTFLQRYGKALGLGAVGAAGAGAGAYWWWKQKQNK